MSLSRDSVHTHGQCSFSHALGAGKSFVVEVEKRKKTCLADTVVYAVNAAASQGRFLPKIKKKEVVQQKNGSQTTQRHRRCLCHRQGKRTICSLDEKLTDYQGITPEWSRAGDRGGHRLCQMHWMIQVAYIICILLFERRVHQMH